MKILKLLLVILAVSAHTEHASSTSSKALNILKSFKNNPTIQRAWKNKWLRRIGGVLLGNQLLHVINHRLLMQKNPKKPLRQSLDKNQKKGLKQSEILKQHAEYETIVDAIEHPENYKRAQFKFLGNGQIKILISKSKAATIDLVLKNTNIIPFLPWKEAFRDAMECNKHSGNDLIGRKSDLAKRLAGLANFSAGHYLTVPFRLYELYFEE